MCVVVNEKCKLGSCLVVDTHLVKRSVAQAECMRRSYSSGNTSATRKPRRAASVKHTGIRSGCRDMDL